MKASERGVATSHLLSTVLTEHQNSKGFSQRQADLWWDLTALWRGFSRYCSATDIITDVISTEGGKGEETWQSQLQKYFAILIKRDGNSWAILNLLASVRRKRASRKSPFSWLWFRASCWAHSESSTPWLEVEGPLLCSDHWCLWLCWRKSTFSGAAENTELKMVTPEDLQSKAEIKLALKLLEVSPRYYLGLQ